MTGLPRGGRVGAGMAALALAATVPAAAAQVLPDTTGPDPTGAATALETAWLDDTARRLMKGARTARDTALLAIESYTAIVRERVSADLPWGLRPTPFADAEFATRVRWSRDEPTIAHILGARERNFFRPENRVDFDWSARTERYAADPLRDPFTFGMLVLADGLSGGFPLVHSPLGPNAERWYQFRSGDTTTVTLPGGEIVRTIQVSAIPRVRSIRLVAAILWIEPESFGLARVAYRLAKRMDSEMSFTLRRGGTWAPGIRIRAPATEAERERMRADSAGSRPPDSFFDRVANRAWRGFTFPPAFELRIVVADYQLRELRYWLPRAVRWEGNFGIAEDVTPDGQTFNAAPVTFDWALEIEEVVEADGQVRREVPSAAGDLRAGAAEALEAWSQAGDSIDGAMETAKAGDVVTILPRTQGTLLRSEHLPPPLREDGIGAPAQSTADALVEELARIGTGEAGEAVELRVSPWSFDPPVETLRLLRHNEVEGLSVGSRLARRYGSLRTSLTVRVPTKSLEAPDLLLTLARDLASARVVASGYRALRLGGGGLDNSFLAGGNRSDYHWAHGGALQLVPRTGQRDWLTLRAFAERQNPLDDGDIRERFGAQFDWRPWWGGAWRDLGAGLSLRVRGVGGDDPHLKAMVAAGTLIPLGDDLALGLEAGAARVWGEPGRRDLWGLGGTGRWLRGHDGVGRAGEVWRGRVELQRRIRGYSVSLFGDWARGDGVDHLAVGTGLTFGGGLFRFDLAHGIPLDGPGLTEPARLRFHLLGGRFF